MMASRKRSRENDENEGSLRGGIDDKAIGIRGRGKNEEKRRKVEDPFFPYSKYTTKFQFPTSFERSTSRFITSTPTSQSAQLPSSSSFTISSIHLDREIHDDKSSYRSPPIISPPSSPLSSKFRRRVKLTRSSSWDDSGDGRNPCLYNEDEGSSGSDSEIVLGKSPYPLIRKPKAENRNTPKDLPILADLSIEEEHKMINTDQSGTTSLSPSPRSESGRNPFMTSTSSNTSTSTSTSQFSSSSIKTPATFSASNRITKMGKGDRFDDIFSPSTPSSSSSPHLPNLFAPRKPRTSVMKQEEESPTRLLRFGTNSLDLPDLSRWAQERITDEDTDMIDS